MIRLQPHSAGTILPVRAQPSARRNEILGEHNGRLKVSVTQAPERGKANKALIVALSKALGLPKSRIELFAGETTSEKRFLIHGVTPEMLAAKVEPLIR